MVVSMVMVMMMAQKSSVKSNLNGSDELNPIFHDFLGMSCGQVTVASKAIGCIRGDVRLLEGSTSASASVGASSGGGGGGGHGPISTISDLASERKMGNHLEGIPFYGPRSDLPRREISNRFTGSKRSNSDSAFMVSSRDGFPQIGPDSVESSHLMKILKNGAGGERPRQCADEEHLFGVKPRRPTSASLALQHPSGVGRHDVNVSKFDRSAAMNVATPSLRMGQLKPLVHQAPSNRYRDMHAGPSIISQSAADEGSRTGLKGSGILGSINACSGASDRSPSTFPASGSRSKPGAHFSEPESSTPPGGHGLTSVSRQMTIFYGGQAHVFDDVHPNKADVIMALAGSNGGSWSTSYSPKCAVKSVTESYMPNGEKKLATTSNMAYSQEFCDRLHVTSGTSSQASGPGDRIIKPDGVPRGCLIIKGSRNPVQSGEAGTKEKR